MLPLAHEPITASLNHTSPQLADIPEMAELTVLLPKMQASALEEAAHQDGLTAGQFLRRLIRQALQAQ